MNKRKKQKKKVVVVVVECDLNRFIAHDEAVEGGPNESVVSDFLEKLLINTVMIEEDGGRCGDGTVTIDRCEGEMLLLLSHGDEFEWFAAE